MIDKFQCKHMNNETNYCDSEDKKVYIHSDCNGCAIYGSCRACLYVQDYKCIIGEQCTYDDSK